MWTCPMCETANEGENCVVCGEAKPKYDEVPVMPVTHDVIQMQQNTTDFDDLGGGARQWNETQDWGASTGGGEVENGGAWIIGVIGIVLFIVLVIILAANA